MTLLESLVENSLVERRRPEDGEARFGMLQSIREYAFERLRELGEFEESHRALAGYYLRLVEEAESDVAGPAQRMWLRRITADYNNIRGALSASLGLGDSDHALRLGSSLVLFWEARGMLSEGRSWLEDALAASNTDPSARATALTGAGRLALLQGDYEQAERLLREGLELAEEVGDQQTRGRALAWLSRTATARHDYASAVQLALTADHVARKIDDRDLLASALAALGSAAAREGDHRHARLLLEQSYNLRRELGNPSSIATSLLDLGWIALLEGDFGRADELFEDALRHCRELDDVSKTAVCLTDLGLSALRQGALERAEEQLQESLALCARLMDRQTAALCLCGLAGLAGARGDGVRAARLAGAAEALRQRVGVALWPVENAIYDDLVHPLRDVVGDTEFSRAWADGRLLESDVLRSLGDETRLRHRTMSGIQWVIGAGSRQATRST
jgi:tetratricopeptide (TPR) repeat protein